MNKYIDAEWLCNELGDINMDIYTDEVKEYIDSAPSIEICFCRECKWEWTKKCPPHRMGLIHDESDYCSYGIRKGADHETD